MTLKDLRGAAEALAESEVVGVEIAELASPSGDHASPIYVTALPDALDPLLLARQPA